jgi:hypothetical protein
MIRYDRRTCYDLALPAASKRRSSKKNQEKKVVRYFSPRSTLPSASELASTSLVIPAGKKQLADADYVPLPDLESLCLSDDGPSKKRPKSAFTILNSTDPLGIYDAGTAAYALGKAKDGGQVDDKFDDVYSLSVTRTELREKVAQLNRAVSENPRDASCWLALVRIQDEVVKEDFQASVKATCVQNH